MIPRILPSLARAIYEDRTRATAARRGVAGIIEFIQQVPEAVGNPLLDHIVVNSLEDIAEPSLVLATQASCGPR